MGWEGGPKRGKLETAEKVARAAALGAALLANAQPAHSNAVPQKPMGLNQAAKFASERLNKNFIKLPDGRIAKAVDSPPKQGPEQTS